MPKAELVAVEATSGNRASGGRRYVELSTEQIARACELIWWAAREASVLGCKVIWVRGVDKAQSKDKLHSAGKARRAELFRTRTRSRSIR